MPATKEIVQLDEISFGTDSITCFEVSSNYLAVSQSFTRGNRGTISVYKTSDFSTQKFRIFGTDSQGRIGQHLQITKHVLQPKGIEMV